MGTAPTRAPQNLHAIRTDSGLILEWEEVTPEDPGEGPLGPYKLSWVQENGTQVRETVPSASPTVLESLPCTSETYVSGGSGHPQTASGNTLHLLARQAPCLIGLSLLWDSPLYANQEAYPCPCKGGGAAGDTDEALSPVPALCPVILW